MEKRRKYLIIAGLCFAFVTAMRVMVLDRDLSAGSYELFSSDGSVQLILVASCLLIALSFFISEPALSAVGCLGCLVHALSQMGVSLYWAFRVALECGMDYNGYYSVCQIFAFFLWLCHGAYFLFLVPSFVRQPAAALYVGAIVSSCLSFVFFMIAMLWFEIKPLIILDILEYAARTLVPAVLYVSLKSSRHPSAETPPEAV